MGKELSPRRTRFVEEYLIDCNGAQAAIRAGYSPGCASVTATRLIGDANVMRAINAGRAKQAVRSELTQDYVINTIRETIERCRQGEPVRYANGDLLYVSTPDGDVAPVYKYDAAAVLKGTELLGKHLGMFGDRLQVEGIVSHDWTVRVIEPEPLRLVGQVA